MADPISHVNVVRLDGELFITWRGGESASTAVFVSDSPDDAGTEVRAPDRPGKAVISVDGLAPEHLLRPYVHIFDPDSGFVVAAERRIEMDGSDNFRDLGGYPTLDGDHTRWGRVFRSDRLNELSADDLATWDSLGISHVFDLRSQGEVDESPDRLPSRVSSTHLPMSSDVAQGRSMYHRIMDGDLESISETDMADGYVRMLDNFGASFLEIVNHLASGEAFVFHCTAGKDRTGVAAMVLLGVAGVADSYILDDYEISERFRDPQRLVPFKDRLREEGHDPEDFAAMFGSLRGVMRQTLDRLYDGWGSVENYLLTQGATAETLERARHSLTT